MIKNMFDYIFEKKEKNPHKILGLHSNKIRVFHPYKTLCFIKIKNKKYKADLIDKRGFFQLELMEKIKNTEYKVIYSENEFFDPYSFEPKVNLNHSLYGLLGAHKKIIDGVDGIQFGLWAPNAKGASVIGDFNDWDGHLHQMKFIKQMGCFFIFIPKLKFNQKYKFEITTSDGFYITKTDPFGYFFELRPHNSSITFDLSSFKWEDKKWIQKREKINL